MDRKVSLIGIASGWGATNMGTALGAKHIFSSYYPEITPQSFPEYVSDRATLLEFHQWESFYPSLSLEGEDKDQRKIQALQVISAVANEVQATLKQGYFPFVFGGDHSIAIGTWSAISLTLKEDVGLIWIDAHMDAHTFETTPSNALHGMPVAALLGYGSSELTHLLGGSPKIKSENVAYIGVRSFEAEEAALLHALGVKIFTMEQIQQQGFAQALEQAKQHVTASCQYYGISLDVDAFDPLEAPGTGALAPGGLKQETSLKAFRGLLDDPKLIAFELVEYNPLLDQDNKTEYLIWRLIDELKWRKS
jgi:arginase